jgi:hypothetical protein
MAIRWKRWAAIFVAAVAAYAALGFWAVPWVVKRELASYAQEQLQRQASVGELRFNPFTLRLEATELRLDEADGAPILGVGRFTVELQWRSLLSRAWRLAEIGIERPVVSLAIAPDGRFNMAELAAAASRGTQPSADASLPRMIIERFAITDGRIDMQDRHAGYSNTFAPFAFELTDFSTLPDRNDEYTFAATSRSGGSVHWKGHASVNPIRATGVLAIDNAPLPQLSVYLRSKVRATVAAGLASANLPYAVSYANGKFEARLLAARVAMQDVALAREGATDSFASLTRLEAKGIDADLVNFDVNVAELRAERGRLSVRRDTKGRLDLANLVVESAGPAAAPANGKTVQVAHWKAGISRIVLDKVAVTAIDETVNPPVKLAMENVGAQLSLRAAQQGETLDMKISDASLALGGVALSRGDRPAQKITRIGFEGGTLDLATRHAALERVYVDGGHLHIARDRAGALDLASWIPKAGPASPNAHASEGAAWTATVGTIQLDKLDADIADEQSGVKLQVVDAHAKLEGAGTDLKQAVKFDAGLSLREGGQIRGEGSVVPSRGAVQAQLSATKVALKPLQPLLAQYVKLKIASGAVSAQGKFATGTGQAKNAALHWDGSFNVDNVLIRELDDAPFAAWKNIGAARVVASVSPNRIEIPELRIVGVDTKLLIDEDRSFNAARLLVKQDAKPAAAAPSPASSSSAEAFPVRIRRVRISDAKLDFTDLSLRPQFAAKIQDLGGVINGLSTSRTARAQIELDGRVDEFGMARIRGETSLAAPKNNTDMNFVFRNVDMVPASPYSMKFAGYRIAEGKISLDLLYKIRDGKLDGDNKIVIDKLTLGERVDSPDALKIPLQLAIAILKDSDGRIDLGLPVSGDLNDPKFSYGAIIWKAITNVLTKMVTAPFRALGAMLGVSGEKLEAIDFDPGSGALHPPEREKLKQVAQILSKREALKLSIPGQYSPAADGAALRARAVRIDVAKQAGIELKDGEEPGPLDFGDRRIRSAVREVYARRFGDEELDKAKKAAETTAPASASSAPSQRSLPMWQRAANLIQGEPQVADASSFYNNLREKLEREHALPPDALKQLGEERATAVAAALAQAGVDPARASVAGAEATDSPVGKPVPLKLGLAAR